MTILAAVINILANCTRLRCKPYIFNRVCLHIADRLSKTTKEYLPVMINMKLIIAEITLNVS